MMLAQVEVEEKSNEITAIAALLSVLELRGCIVTLNAMGCQQEIATAIEKVFPGLAQHRLDMPKAIVERPSVTG